MTAEPHFRGRPPSRLPSWAVPAIVLGVVAVAGLGLALGMYLAGNGGPAASSTTAGGATTTSASGAPATEAAACVALRQQEGLALAEAEAICATLEVGTPVVTGDSLPAFESVETDTAPGLTIPEVAGQDFAGNPVSITRDGRAKVIVFFAHWCSVCRQEVPLLAGWLPGAALPQGVDFISVSTGVRIDRANYPPSRWLADVGWTVPVILDDEQYRVAQAFGLNAYPYFVFVDAAGRVALRAAGGLPIESIELVLAQLAEA